jgi:hypothetical protein
MPGISHSPPRKHRRRCLDLDPALEIGLSVEAQLPGIHAWKVRLDVALKVTQADAERPHCFLAGE